MVIWLQRNVNRVALVLGVGLVIVGAYRILGLETAMIITGLMLIAGSLRRSP